MHYVSASLSKQGVQKDTMLNIFVNLIQLGCSDDIKILDVTNSQKTHSTSPVSYQIVGDNVDLEVKVPTYVLRQKQIIPLV